MSGRVKRAVTHLLRRARRFDPRETLLLVADARGGSTWTAQALKLLPGTYYNPEPLHLSYTPELARVGFGWRQHIAQRDEWPAVRGILVDGVLTGRRPNYAQAWQNSYRALATGRQLLVKLVRGKLLLPWLIDELAPRHPPVVLVRHPLAMISSMRRSALFDYPFEPVDLAPLDRGSGVYSRHAALFASLTTIYEQQVAYWAVANAYLLRHPYNGRRFHVYSYEELLRDPLATLGRMAAQWQRDLPASVESHIARPSHTSDRGAIDPVRQLGAWRSELPPDLQRRYAEIFAAVGVDFYSADSDLPTVDLATLGGSPDAAKSTGA